MSNLDWHYNILATLETDGYIKASEHNKSICNYIVRLYHTNEVEKLDKGDLIESARLHFGFLADKELIAEVVDNLIAHKVLTSTDLPPDKVFRKDFVIGEVVAIN